MPHTVVRITMFAALQSDAIWRMKMKEPHCWLFSGKVTSVGTPSSLFSDSIELASASDDYCNCTSGAISSHGSGFRQVLLTLQNITIYLFNKIHSKGQYASNMLLTAV